MSATFLPASTEAVPTPTSKPLPEYEDLPSRRLIALAEEFSKRTTHPEAQSVFNAFYRRYRPYLIAVSRNLLGTLFGSGEIEDLVHNAMVDYFRKCDKTKAVNAESDVHCDRMVRAYIGQKIRWEAGKNPSFRARYGNPVNDLAAAESESKLIDEITVPPELLGAIEELSENDAARFSGVRSWLDTLNEFERDIVQTYFLDDHLGQKSSRLPNGIAERIAVKYGMSTSNVRKTKGRLCREFKTLFRHFSP